MLRDVTDFVEMKLYFSQLIFPLAGGSLFQNILKPFIVAEAPRNVI